MGPEKTKYLEKGPKIRKTLAISKKRALPKKPRINPALHVPSRINFECWFHMLVPSRINCVSWFHMLVPRRINCESWFDMLVSRRINCES